MFEHWFELYVSICINALAHRTIENFVKDNENRNKLPKNISIPPLQKFNKSKYQDILSTQIKKKFCNHPGKIDNF